MWRSYRWLLLTLNQRLQVKRRCVAVHKRVGANFFQGRLQENAKRPDHGLFVAVETRAILGQNFLITRINFGLTFGRELGEGSPLAAGAVPTFEEALRPAKSPC